MHHVLVVDDDQSIIDIITHMLEAMGYVVSGYTNPAVALGVFSMSPYRFDLVITDLDMPELSGLELVEAILNIRPATKVIILTGHPRPIPGGLMCLTKPVAFGDLKHVIGTILTKEG